MNYILLADVKLLKQERIRLSIKFVDGIQFFKTKLFQITIKALIIIRMDCKMEYEQNQMRIFIIAVKLYTEKNIKQYFFGK
ncbi:unnamed protein product [Paramecium octaurelia]|uniref:Uncharacterized protein n=1 Tax=Paramecium octaurelia TaxID=43137 RepID=A0A8S1YPE0_PAROT|nr:unnamed protein product [Paramecium octaurelia]